MIPQRIANAGHSLTLGDGINPCMLGVAALSYEFGRLLNVYPSCDYVEKYGTSYDRLLAGCLRLAIHASAILEEVIEAYHDGVFTYECIELPRDVTKATGQLPAFLWNKMEWSDFYDIAENFTAPKQLSDWVWEWVDYWNVKEPGAIELKAGASVGASLAEQTT